MAERMCFLFFFFNDTATTEIYTLSLHDALPICRLLLVEVGLGQNGQNVLALEATGHVPERDARSQLRSEEHTSELQSLTNLVCRLLLEKKKKQIALLDTDAWHIFAMHCVGVVTL